MSWFEVDRKGLGQLIERRGKSFVLFELLQNALDTDAHNVAVHVEPLAGRPAVEIVVEDDHPDGFADLAHAFTLFAPSEKKGDAGKRGRFNLGEKMVLALALEAEIISTKGAVRFDVDGRHLLRKRRERGSTFRAIVRMTRQEAEAAVSDARRIIVPTGVYVSINGQNVDERRHVTYARAELPTETADEEGVLRRRTRLTTITVFEPALGTGWLYEMGIPVCETGDRFDVDIAQKIPLNMERDGVTLAYLRTVRAHVLNAAAAWLSKEESTAKWVTDGLLPGVTRPEAALAVKTKRFGANAVAADPSDVEANRISASQGRTVVSGGSLPAEAWEVMREAGALPPAGQVTPSPKPFHPDGSQLKTVDEADWTPEIRAVVEYARRLAKAVLGRGISVTVAKDRGWKFGAAYGPGHLTINIAGRDLADREGLNRTLIHEFAHSRGGHLTEEFDDAMRDIGAQMVELAIADPSFFLLGGSR